MSEMTAENMQQELVSLQLEITDLTREESELPERMAAAARQGQADRIEDLKRRKTEITELRRALRVRQLGLKVSLQEPQIERTREQAAEAVTRIEPAHQRVRAAQDELWAAEEALRRVQGDAAALQHSVTVQEAELTKLRDELAKLVAEELEGEPKG